MTKPDIQALSKLARIDLLAEEAESLAKESENILGFVEQIQGAKNEGGAHVPQTGAVFNVFRDDINPHESGIYTDAILGLAPAREGNYIKVKKIL